MRPRHPCRRPHRSAWTHRRACLRRAPVPRRAAGRFWIGLCFLAIGLIVGAVLSMTFAPSAGPAEWSVDLRHADSAAIGIPNPERAAADGEAAPPAGAGAGHAPWRPSER